MNSINEIINEKNNIENLPKLNSKKINSSQISRNKIENKYEQKSTSKKSDNKKNIITLLSNLSNHNEDYKNKNNSINNLTNTFISKNKDYHINLLEKILLELFLDISEFNESNFDFFLSYTNLINMLRNKGLIDNIVYNNVILRVNDLDIILKEILTNKNASKKLDFFNFLRFLAHLAYKIDTIHFIDKPKRTFNFIINKYFNNDYKTINENGIIRTMYNYILIIQEEKHINEILNEIIPFLAEIYVNYFHNDNTDFNNCGSFEIDKNNFKCIVQIMKFLGLHPILINIKELVIMFFIILDDNNDNKYLMVEDININNIFKFKKFCQFFLTLCLYIKEKNDIVLKQYYYLLNKDKSSAIWEQKEKIISFILNLNISNRNINSDLYQKKYLYKNNNIKKEINDELNLSNEEIEFILQIFEYYSSYIDEYLNYQISFSDIIILLKDYKFLLKYNIYPNLLMEKVTKAQIKSRNNIQKLKKSLHSLDHLFNHRKEKYESSKYNINYNQISLGELEIIFSKIYNKQKININKSMDEILFNTKEYNLKIRLNFHDFINFLSLLSKKLNFESFSEFLKYLSYESNKINKNKFRNKNINLKYIFAKYYKLLSNEIISIIQEFHPIINLFFISYKRKRNINKITFKVYLNLFSEFEIFPKLINYNVLKNIFLILHQINPKKEINYNEDNKIIDFNELMYSFGIISLYLNDLYKVNKIKNLLCQFYLISNSDKIKLYIKDMNFDFINILKNKIDEISLLYNNFKDNEEPEFLKFLKEPYL